MCDCSLSSSQTAFVGPACGLALDPVARMAAHWNIPVFTSGGLQAEFSRKTTFSTLTRLAPSLEKMGVFLRYDANEPRRELFVCKLNALQCE